MVKTTTRAQDLRSEEDWINLFYDGLPSATEVRLGEATALLAVANQFFEERGKYQSQVQTLATERDKARADRKETLEQFADLKSRLHDAEIENARLQGYLDRVADDDMAREEPIQVKESDGTTLVPRRPPRMRTMIEGAVNMPPDVSWEGGYRKEKKRVHWVNYG